LGDYNLLGRPASRLFLICLFPFYFPTDVVTYITALTADAGSSLLRLWLYSQAIIRMATSHALFSFSSFFRFDRLFCCAQAADGVYVYTEAIVSLSLIEKENVFSFSKRE
jgi:hypothetical protein